MSQEFIWAEKYRPKKVQDCILPDHLKRRFQSYVDKKEIPNLLLFGTKGLGKTTVARALCEEVGCDYLFINGSTESGIDVLRNKIQNFASSVSIMGTGRKVIIIDEADFLNAQSTQPAFRAAVEEFSSNCTFIFTCNFRNRLLGELLSRFQEVDFKLRKEDKPKIATAFLKRVEWILQKENVKYEKDVVASFITKYFPDNRKVLIELQGYASFSDIDKGILSYSAEIHVAGLVLSLKQKNFAEVRKWVINNMDNDPARLYRFIYDSLYEKLVPQSVPQLVLILAKYQYQAAFVADHEINLMACLTEVMVDCEFK